MRQNLVFLSGLVNLQCTVHYRFAQFCRSIRPSISQSHFPVRTISSKWVGQFHYNFTWLLRIAWKCVAHDNWPQLPRSSSHLWLTLMVLLKEFLENLNCETPPANMTKSMQRVNHLNKHLSPDMWFQTKWHFDKCRLRWACAASL